MKVTRDSETSFSIHYTPSERISGMEYIALIDNMTSRSGLSHDRCRKICTDLSNNELERLNELVKHPSRDGEIDDLLGMRAFSPL